jgi:hypothetical protein
MIKLFAQLVSVVFHPVFLFVYIIVLLLIINPYMFGFANIVEAKELLLIVVLTVIPIPIIVVLLQKGLGLSESIYLRNKRERIGPYLVSALLYLSLYLQLAKTNSANAIQVATLGAVVALFGAFFLNNFYKISLHAIGSGALISMLVLTVMFYSRSTYVLRVGDKFIGEYDTIVVLYLSIILTGVICSSRLFLKQHSIQEIYSGLVLGFFAPLIAYYIIQ